MKYRMGSIATYPERKVMQLPYAHVMSYSWYGGDIHCATWQQPGL
jgi:hypothetical protein